MRRVDLSNWALRTSPKFTTGVKYQFHQEPRLQFYQGLNRCGSFPLLLAPQSLSLASEQTLKEHPRGTTLEMRVDLANWALRNSPKFTTGVKYQFHQEPRLQFYQGLNRCGSFQLLSAPQSLFSIWTDLNRSGSIPGAPSSRWGEWIWLTGPSGIHRNSPQGLRISSMRVFFTRLEIWKSQSPFAPILILEY